MSRISPDQYPQDVLNVLQAINNMAIEKSTYKYDNAATPFTFRKFLVISRRTTDFNSVVEAQAFDDYCVENNIEVELEISFMMRTIIDWIELEKLVKGLKPSKTVKRWLKVDLSESEYILDLDSIPSLGPIKGRIIALSIYLSPYEFSRGAIDLEFLRDIEVLELDRCSVNGSFSQCHKLRELKYLAPNENNPVDLLTLPLTLKRLHLDCCEDITAITGPVESTKFPSLELVSVSYEGSELPPSVTDIFRFMTCSETTSIEYDGAGDSADDEFLEILYEEAGMKGFQLETLKLIGSFESKLQLLPTRRLDQTNIPDEPWYGSELPSTLEEMYLDGFAGQYSWMNINFLPTSLVKLELSDGIYIFWADIDLDFSKYLNMKTLQLQDCALEYYIDDFTFPDSLEELYICGNDIKSINKVKFPKKLKRLTVTSEKVKDVSKALFPQSLKELDLSGNRVKKIDIVTNKFGEPLQIDLLDMRGNESKLILSECKLPSTLRYLAMDNCVQDEAFHFNDSLCVLHLSLCEFKKQLDVTFGSNLRSLVLLECGLTHFSINLPDALEEIDLSHNNLTEVPVQLCNLTNLKTISVSYNKIPTVYLNFASSSLEVFDMHCNEIKEIQLTFPESVTNLRLVDLSVNQLSKFSMASIGHNGKTLHNNLYELVLSQNDLLPEDGISTLLHELPGSTQFMWGNNEGEHFDCGSVYVTNELPSKYLVHRRIHFKYEEDLDLDTDSVGELDLVGSDEVSDLNMESDRESVLDKNLDGESDLNMDSD